MPLRPKSQTQYEDYTYAGRKIRHPNHSFHRMAVEDVCLGFAYPLNWIGNLLPTTIFDIGAGVGAAAIYFHHYFPEAHIYCFEPDPDLYELLKKNTSFIPKISTFPIALYHENASLPLYQPSAMSHFGTLVSDDSSLPSRNVSTRKAREMFHEIGVDQVSILKIAAEGAESGILLDLFTHKIPGVPIAAIFVEHFSVETKNAITQFLDNDYSCFKLSHSVPGRFRRLYLLKELLPLLDSHRLERVR